MNIQEHKKHMLDRFSKDECVEILSNTLDVWRFKKKIQLENGGPLEKCNRSITYFEKLRSEILNDFYCHDENVMIAEETGDDIKKCNDQCSKCKNG